MPLVHEDPELAERSSLLGRAQRGQGGAFRELLEVEAARAAEVVAACAIRDPRPDRQLDSRGGYYGALIARRGLAIEPIERHLREEPGAGELGETGESGRELAADVLAHAAARGHAASREALLEYLPRGAHWQEVVAVLALAGAEDRDVAERVAARFADGEAVAGAADKLLDHGPADQLLALLGGHPHLRAILEGALEARSREGAAGETGWHSRMQAWLAAAGGEPGRPLREQSTRVLLELAERGLGLPVSRALEHPEHALDLELAGAEARSGTKRRRWCALGALGSRRCDLLLELAPPLVRELETPDPRRDGDLFDPCFTAYRALGHLGSPAAAARAREWIRSDAPLGHAAWLILVNAGEERDAAAIEAAYDRFTFDDVYLATDLVDRIREQRLVRHSRIARELLRDSAYDYLRNRCLTALLELDPGYASSRELEDALWDASPEVLVSAARATPLTPPARGRLAELAADALEHEDVRAAARERLATGP